MTHQQPQQQERCCHHDVCYMVHRGHGCINDKPTEIPCIFDSRKGVNFSACSRPAPSTEVPVDFRRIWNEHMQKHDATITAKEREDVLDELKSWFVKNKCNGCAHGMNLLTKIESLRTTTSTKGGEQ
jgi:hypothetical protein